MKIKTMINAGSAINWIAEGSNPKSGCRNSKEIRSAKAKQRRAGFTLVEMLLVLVILATLAAIVYPKVAGRSEQARVTAAATQIGNFKTALNAFEVDNSFYPKGKSGLNDLVQAPRDATSWHGPYLDNIPKDPWGNDYIYESPGKHNPSSFDVSSMGPPGKDTPIGNWTVQQK